MSPNSENVRETVALIRQVGLQVRDVGELRAVLKELQSALAPDTTRLRLGLILMVALGAVSFGAAAVVSWLLLTGNWMAPAGRDAPGYCLGGLGIVWGVVGLVMLCTVMAVFGPQTPPPQPGKGSTTAANDNVE
jgi:hypothetical protein